MTLQFYLILLSQRKDLDMALNAAQLATEMEAAVRTSQGLDNTPYPELTAYCTAVAQAFVDHIVANAEVTGTAEPSGDTVEGTIS